MGSNTLTLNPKARGAPARSSKQIPSRARGPVGKEVVVVAKSPQKKRFKPLKSAQRRMGGPSNYSPPTGSSANVRTEISAHQRERMKRALLQAKILDQKEEAERELRELEEQRLEAERARAHAELRKREAEEEAELKNRKEDEARAKEQSEEVRKPKTPDTKVVQKKAQPSDAPKTTFASRKSRKTREKEAADNKKGRGDPRRRPAKKVSVYNALVGERQKSIAAFHRRELRKRRKAQLAPLVREKIVRDVRLPETIVVQELANRMAERVSEVVKLLMKNGIIATQNQPIDADTAEIIVREFGHRPTRVSDADVEDVIVTVEDNEENLQPRSPVITVMGHVDHGKTSLLDAIRKTSVASSEDGGITQHIGAYQVTTESDHTLTFLDTPGHAAFTDMRARGANITDIVVLVVAADDSVMPQTAEAINHANAANVPLVVAINKCDLPDADPDSVRNALLRHGVVVEGRSGEILDVEMSAATGQGIDELLEAVSLQTELLELKANPNRAAEGAVIEARLDVGKGPVATILVQNGTLEKGNIFVVGEQWGKVRALIDDKENRIDSAGPSVPVEVLGLNGTPLAGDILNVVENESQAREISAYRLKLKRDKLSAAGAVTNLEDFLMIRDGKEKAPVKDLQLVVKADVHGSAEAITQAIEKIGNDEVQVRVIHSGVGAITESDISLADSSAALVVGFNVRANAPARLSASQKGVEIRYYSIIYRLVDDVKSLASGMLDAKINEIYLGKAEILEIFKVTGVGIVAGCRVSDGVVRRSAGVRLLRDDVVIHEGKLKTLKRFKDEVAEVQAGQECGMAFENYSNIQKGDFIEVFDVEEIEQTL